MTSYTIKMKKSLLPILCFFSLITYGQENNVAFDGHTWEAPYSLPAPKDWGIERFLVPPGFAPSITYKGVEDIRFAPGWAKQTSEEYWSYAFLWYLESKPALTEASIERDLKAYYTGLLKVNSDSATLAKEPPITVQAKFKMTQATKHGYITFTGTITMLDYMTRKPITLNCKVESKPCPETGKEFVFFELSPKPFEHTIWKSLGLLWQDFRCVK
jgi:hypothetical protein